MDPLPTLPATSIRSVAGTSSPQGAADLDGPAAHGHVVGVQHDARLRDQLERPAAHFGVDLQRRPAHLRLGEVQGHGAAVDPYLHPLRNGPAAVALGAAAVAFDADHFLRLSRGRPGRRSRRGRQVRDQALQLSVGARGQGRLDPLVELVKAETPIARGHPQQFNDPVPVLVRGTQVVPGIYVLGAHVRLRVAARLRHGVSGARLRHGVSGARLRHDVSGARLRHDLSGARLRHDVSGARLRHDVCRARRRGGVTRGRTRGVICHRETLRAWGPRPHSPGHGAKQNRQFCAF